MNSPNPYVTLAAGVAIGSLLTVGIAYAAAPRIVGTLVERAIIREGLGTGLARTARLLVEREVRVAL